MTERERKLESVVRVLIACLDISADTLAEFGAVRTAKSAREAATRAQKVLDGE